MTRTTYLKGKIILATYVTMVKTLSAIMSTKFRVTIATTFQCSRLNERREPNVLKLADTRAAPVAKKKRGEGSLSLEEWRARALEAE